MSEQAIEWASEQVNGRVSERVGESAIEGVSDCASGEGVSE